MEDTFILKDENGKEVEFIVIDSFYHEEFGKGYVIYTDESVNGLGQMNLFVSSFDQEYPDDLKELETQEEWAMIEEVMKGWKEDEDQSE